MVRIRESHVLITVLILSMAGMGLSTFLVANHYQYVGAEFCNIGWWSNCQDVNTGPYSTIFAIPWSVIGLVGFAAIFALAYLRLYYPRLDVRERFIPLILILSIVGTIFIVYLNYLEFFVIHRICLLCAASHVLMIVILVLVVWWFFVGQHKVQVDQVVEVSSSPGGSQ